MTRARLSVALLVVLVLGALGIVVGNATALPGDPPIAPVGPADGASVPAVEEGLKVTYTCPSYRSTEEVEEIEVPVPPKEEEGGEEEGEEGEEEEAEEEETEVIEKLVPVFGSTETYGARFSTSSALGADGRLTTTGFGEAGEGEAEVAKGTPWCNTELALPTSPNPAALYQGRVYWQAFRECEGCKTGFETGPVQSFVVVPNDEEAEISFEDQVFGGYLTKVSFAGAAGLKGAKVALQQWIGSEWKTIGEEPGTELGENRFFVKLGAGHKLLRPVLIGVGVTLPLEEKAKTVRKARKGAATGIKTGEWVYALKSEREEFPLSFRVTNNGTMLRGLTAAMEATCTNPADKRLKTTIEASSSVKEARINPNGTVVAHFSTAGATPSTVTLTGNFFNGRFSGLLTSNFLTNCEGFREFEAVPAPKGSGK